MAIPQASGEPDGGEGVRLLIGRLACWLVEHKTVLGPYAHSDHFTDTSYCVRCRMRWGLGWRFLTKSEIQAFESSVAGKA